MGWFHLACTDSEEYVRYARKNTIWTCPTCRAIPSTLSSLQADVRGLINLLHHVASDSSVNDASPQSLKTVMVMIVVIIIKCMDLKMTNLRVETII